MNLWIVLTVQVFIYSNNQSSHQSGSRCSQVFNEANEEKLTTFCDSANSSVLPLESERRSGAPCAEGAAFTLLHEGDTHVSDALEHSDRPPQPSSLLCRKCACTVQGDVRTYSRCTNIQCMSKKRCNKF